MNNALHLITLRFNWPITVASTTPRLTLATRRRDRKIDPKIVALLEELARYTVWPHMEIFPETELGFPPAQTL
jgi:hypothetical protein